MKWSPAPLIAAVAIMLTAAAAAAPAPTPAPATTGIAPPAAQAAAPVAAAADPTANTTGPLTKPLVASIATGVWHINEFGADSIYLVIGEKRALVIDTGSGFFDLKALVESLTKLPYDVAITHGHPDHAGGIEQFDTVYAGPADFQQALGVTYQTRVNYGRTMRAMRIGIPNVWGYSDANVMQWNKKPEMKPVVDGQVFDLGGRKVTAYSVPNHTPGSMVYIDDKSRILFSGDAINGNVQAVGTVSNMLRGFLKVRALSKDYDRIFNGHIAYAGTVAPIQPESLQVLDDLIANARAILNGTANIQQLGTNLSTTTRPTAVLGSARTGFSPDRLWDANEAHVVP